MTVAIWISGWNNVDAQKRWSCSWMVCRILRGIGRVESGNFVIGKSRQS